MRLELTPDVWPGCFNVRNDGEPVPSLLKEDIKQKSSITVAEEEEEAESKSEEGGFAESSEGGRRRHLSILGGRAELRGDGVKERKKKQLP